MKIEDIAMVCYEASRALAQVHGDDSMKWWPGAPQQQRDAWVAGVRHVQAHPGVTAATAHIGWMEQKIEDGWSHGPRVDALKLLHPLLLPYDKLPPLTQAQDRLFIAICQALLPLVET